MTRCPRPHCGGSLWKLPEIQGQPAMTICTLCSYDGATRAPTLEDQQSFGKLRMSGKRWAVLPKGRAEGRGA
jgi:hypothetical protein